MTEDIIEKLKTQYKSKQYFEAFGLRRETATEQQVNKAYQKLMKIFHPDRVSEKLKEEAEECSKIINEMKSELIEYIQYRDSENKNNNQQNPASTHQSYHQYGGFSSSSTGETWDTHRSRFGEETKKAAEQRQRKKEEFESLLKNWEELRMEELHRIKKSVVENNSGSKKIRKLIKEFESSYGEATFYTVLKMREEFINKMYKEKSLDYNRPINFEELFGSILKDYLLQRNLLIQNLQQKLERVKNESPRKEKFNPDFIAKLRKAYYKIKAEEREDSFKKRHIRYEMKLPYDASLPKFLITHISEETLFQLRKILRSIKGKSLSEALTRHRKGLAAGVIVFSLGLFPSIGTAEINEEPIAQQQSQSETITASPKPKIENLKMEKIIIVQTGDTLSDIAVREGVSIENIKLVNGLEITDPNKIIAGQDLLVEKTISKNEIEDNTIKLPADLYENKSIFDLATEFNTTVNTIKNLNPSI